MLEVRPIDNLEIWNNFVKSYAPNTMLQSSNWHDFSTKKGETAYMLGLYDDGKLVGGALFTKVLSRRGNYLVAHGAPMIDWNSSDYFRIFHDYLVSFSQKEKLDFFRIRPPFYYSDEQVKHYNKLGYVLAPMYFQAEHTLLLDLKKTENELMSNLRKNTRYYVRKAEKNGVEIVISHESKDLDMLYELYMETVRRQNFVPYPKEYFINEFESFQKNDLADLVLGYYQGKLVSAAMILYFDQTAYYHHGASIRMEPDVYASYLVQWEAIKKAKQRGMQIYDFWGVAPTDELNHRRAGLTLFKRGFGGERVRWMHTLDYPVSWKYWLMYVYVKYERWRRKSG